MITLLLILLLALVVVGGGGPSSSWQGLNGIRTQLQQPQLSCPRMPDSARIETTTTCSAAHPPVKINWVFTRTASRPKITIKTCPSSGHLEDIPDINDKLPRRLLSLSLSLFLSLSLAERRALSALSRRQGGNPPPLTPTPPHPSPHSALSSPYLLPPSSNPRVSS